MALRHRRKPPTLEAFVKYMHQQNFIPEIIPVDDLFAPTHGRLD